MLKSLLLISTVAAESTPGTETILLVRGGYGPGVNLFSSGSQTHRHLSSLKAPVDRTPSEKHELEKLTEVSQTATVLNSQLQTAVKSTYSALQEAEQVRVDDSNLKEKLAADEKKIQQGAEAEKARAQLEAEVKSLQAQLAAEKVKTEQEHKRGEALRNKATSLEHDIKLLTRSWKDAAQHQANLAKEAQAELKAAQAAKTTTTTVAPKKASVKKAVTKKVAKKAVTVQKENDEDSDADSDSDYDDDEADSADDDSDN